MSICTSCWLATREAAVISTAFGLKYSSVSQQKE